MTTKKIRPKCIEMSMQETLHFISEVKLHNCLWETTHEDYKNKLARDKAWEALSISLGHNADDLVAKWSSLRSSLRQYRSAVRRRARDGDPDALQVVKWPYYSALSFANAGSDDPEPPAISEPTRIERMISHPVRFIKRRKILSLPSQSNFKPIPTETWNTPEQHPSSTHNGTINEPEFIAVKVEALSNPPSPVEHTFTEEAHGCSVLNARDEDDVYAHSIALQMKQFSPRTKRKLQIQILELISAAQKQAYEKEFGTSYDT
uniref:MADF domain-containing protein n=1 Tax=Anopheles minimus TaxID=112268 RepID=A0A182W9I7_9DIPT